MRIITTILLILLTLAISHSYAQQNCRVLSLPFNGNANDESGHNLNGTVNGASLAADRFGNPNAAYAFDGVDDFISIPNDSLIDFDVNDDFSLSLWIKAPMQQTNTSSPGNEILTKWEDYGAGNEGYPFAVRIFNNNNSQDGKVRVVRWDKDCTNLSRATSTSALNDNMFHHLVYVKDGASITLYVDNVLEGSYMDSSVCNTSNGSDLYIGKVGGTNSPNFYEGQVDDIYIYNCALDAVEIESLFFEGTSTTATINPTECISYESPSGNYNWTVSGTYMDTIPNMQGGDSLITINLTINQPSMATISPSACNSYASPSGLFTWINSGTYMDTIANSANCDSVLTIDLTITNIDTSVTPNGNTLAANNANAMYQWLDCGNNYAALPGETNQNYTPSVNGSYAVLLTEANCTDTSQCYSVLQVGVAEQLGLSSIAAYPNPVNDRLFFSGIKERFAYTIYNLQGRVMLSDQDVAKSHLDVSVLPGGTYIIRIDTEQQQAIFRFVVME